MARIRWTMPQPGSDVPLYQEVVAMRDQAMSYPAISKELKERYGIEAAVAHLRKIYEQYREAAPAAASDVVGRAPVAREGEDTDLEDNNDAGNGRRLEAYATGNGVPPLQDGGTTRGLNLGRAGAAMILGQVRAPVLLHVARDGMEIWVSAQSEDEMRLKAASITNLLNLMVNAGEGA